MGDVAQAYTGADAEELAADLARLQRGAEDALGLAPLEFPLLAPLRRGFPAGRDFVGAGEEVGGFHSEGAHETHERHESFGSFGLMCFGGDAECLEFEEAREVGLAAEHGDIQVEEGATRGHELHGVALRPVRGRGVLPEGLHFAEATGVP